MPVTREQVVAALLPEEPNYAAGARRLGAEALPHLAELVRGGDLMLATKAAYLASVIGGAASGPVLEEATRSAHPEVRVAVATGLRHLSDAAAEPVVSALLRDADAGVRKTTLKAAPPAALARNRATLERMTAQDPSDDLRRLSGAVLQRLPR